MDASLPDGPELPMRAAVDRFLALEGARAPDFSPCLVLLPHHHAGQDFRRALRAALPHPVLLPPRLLTLPEWAQGAALAPPADPDSRRLAELQDFLRRTSHLPPASLWQAARELHELLESLDQARVDLDGDSASRVLEARGDNPYLSLEAGIARAVWQAFRQAAPGRSRAYGLRLAWLAEHADQPLYTLGLLGLTPVEQSCLAAWARRQPVHALPAPPPRGACQAWLAATWRETTPPLAQRARAFTRSMPSSPARGRLAIHPAHNLESAARAAERVLLDWLAEGRRDIALVALDRLMARRLRALLERRGILVQDETGWAFSTSAASHVLDRWLALAPGPVWHKDLLDLLKSPFLFALTGEDRPRGVHELEQALRRQGAPATLEGYLALARQQRLTHAPRLLEKLRQAQALFPARRLPLAIWTARLRAALDILEASPALAADAIGLQLLELLARLERESAPLGQAFTLGDWRRWLALHLEQETFSDTSVSSPLRLTHPAAVHHRQLEGVLFLGAGAAHLPGGRRGAFFNDATLRQLGLADATARESLAQDMLMDTLARAPRAAFVWQTERDGDPAPLSPWLIHLDAFHQAAWGDSLLATVAVAPAHARADEALSHVPPTAPGAPTTLSVSAWQSLVSCPYQYFARHVLGLNEQDETPEEMDKAEYGSLVHRVLAHFHAAHPHLAEAAPEHWQGVLRALAAQVFAPAEARDFQALAWRLRWERHIPDYVAWALAREEEGWRFQAAEVPLERAVAWGRAGETTRFHGRADRLDQRGAERAVLDYKTQSRQTLNAKLAADGEDVQLAAYAWLARADRAGFVTVDETRVALLEARADPAGGDTLATRAEAEAARLADTLAGLAAGQPLPAHGAPGTCAWCEMQGLCRRAHRPGAMP